ncbi:MAG: redox-sensing transcriptional repressor Rex [Candidatus Latescibacteria bacterium]|nr:redox-sensing transcriptional repressor Rex [Candidatus Latescibacterota bacterium]OPX24869.1 MAG: redox-sensing transcriptional repressor Rex [Candidatus Latescibacteria bacterium 4484_107]
MSRKISSTGIERLALYYRYLTSVNGSEEAFISSEKLAKAVEHTAAQVRRDLSCFGTFGTPGRGYNRAALEAKLSGILGKEKCRNVVLVGVGNLGSALLAYKGFQSQCYTIVAAFDNDTRKIGKHLKGLEIQDIRKLSAVVSQTRAKMAIISVPADAAQGVVDALILAGIQGILNFAPTRVVVPEDIMLQHVDFSIKLDRLCYELEHA